jgi:hypothetical protein
MIKGRVIDPATNFSDNLISRNSVLRECGALDILADDA